MGGTGVIDRFLEVFTSYIDSGFGLLGSEVGFLASTLAAIDITLAALFWSWGADDDIMARLIKKTLFVGVFAYLIGDWNNLARIVFESFSGLGLKASGSSLSAADFLRPERHRFAVEEEYLASHDGNVYRAVAERSDKASLRPLHHADVDLRKSLRIVNECCAQIPR